MFYVLAVILNFYKMKIFDIIPPHSKLSGRGKFPVKTLGREIKEIKGQKHGFKKRAKIIFLGLLVFFLVFSCFVLKPKTKIEIWHVTKNAEFTTKLKVDSSIKQKEPALWLESGTIPGEVLTAETALSEEFASSGRFVKEEKARGVIRVYNSYSQSTQPLVATTRFISDSGKLFRLPKGVVVPGQGYENGKLAPGWIDVEVAADQPGEEYNIGPSVFSIPGFAGTPKYTAFYAKSFSNMTGGLKAETGRVEDKDLENSRQTLTEKVFAEGRLKLKAQKGEDFKVLEDSIKQEIMEFLPLAKSGQGAERFITQIKAKTTALGFYEQDLKSFAEMYIQSEMGEQTKTREGSLTIDYTFLGSPSAGLEIKIRALTYSELDKETLKKRLQGREVLEVYNILRDFPEVGRVKLEVWPFWAKNVSLDPARIEILDRF